MDLNLDGLRLEPVGVTTACSGSFLTHLAVSYSSGSWEQIFNKEPPREGSTPAGKAR